MKTKNTIEIQKVIDLYKNKKYAEAKKICLKLLKINPKDFRLLHLIGKVELLENNYLEAINYFKSAIEQNSQNTGLLLDLANTFKKVQNYLEAFNIYQLIIRVAPESFEAYHNCGEMMIKMEQYKLAVDLYSKAYHLNDKSMVSLIGIAMAYEAQYDFDMAIAIYKKVLIEDSENISAYLGLGDLYRKINKLEDAMNYVAIAIDKSPNTAKCYSLRGTIQKDLGMLNEAVKDFDRVLELEPKSSVAKNNKSMTLLMLGDYAQGWLLYEARWDIEDWRIKKFSSLKPLWAGEKNVKLLVWAEQGVGDEVMFSSILPDVLKDVSELFVLIDTRLKTLFERSFDPKIKFIATKKEAEETTYDVHISMGSLGKFYRNSIEEFPLQENYLKYDEALTFDLAKKYKFDKSKEFVGISWKSKNPRNGLKRGVELIDFVKKLDNGNRIFLNLQYGEVDEEIDILYQETGIKMINVKEIDNFKNLDGLAALIAMCDEVVSIDNSTVHLSGALGKKTSVLLQHSPDWRWLQEVELSPWYSSIKLIRGAIS